ncbi:hypothetical protein [Pedobacter frigiditerrae]|uniref:hypothetical protein n=1 Tax=Pedobacter frigiditerrae TaxID=2530452 RepID=UPI00292DD503|nr:hypothetical protein [Pedobacter frigiditerrae]
MKAKDKITLIFGLLIICSFAFFTVTDFKQTKEIRKMKSLLSFQENQIIQLDNNNSALLNQIEDLENRIDDLETNSSY